MGSFIPLMYICLVYNPEKITDNIKMGSRKWGDVHNPGGSFFDLSYDTIF